MLASSKLIPELLKPDIALKAPTHLEILSASLTLQRNRNSSLPRVQSVALGQVSTVSRNPSAHANCSQKLPGNEV